jgi:hypothetical protein
MASSHPWRQKCQTKARPLPEKPPKHASMAVPKFPEERGKRAFAELGKSRRET